MASEENPLFAPSDLQYQLPPFDRKADMHFLPAFERGMAHQRAEVEAIASNPEAPSFGNTMIALERSGRLLRRVSSAFFRAGARLGASDRHRLRRINQELSALATAFGKNLLADANELAVRVHDPAELDGLADDEIAAAGRARPAAGIRRAFHGRDPEIGPLLARRGLRSPR